MHFRTALVALATALIATSAAQAEQVRFAGAPDAATRAADQSLLWGTYRPGLYFGLKPRLASSLMTGTMWYGSNDYRGFEREFATPSSWLASCKRV